ncbi:MAG: dihydrofolate reductase [Anaerolineales bacterium]
MRINFILAVDESGAIGAQGRIPWRVRADLQRFKRLTMGHHILMGRRTWESIGRPLPGRINLVVTRQRGFEAAGCVVAASPQEGVALARQAGEQELFVIGGAQLYAALLPQADCIYLSRIQTRVPQADTFFQVDFLSPPDWVRCSREYFPPQEGETCGHIFEVWEHYKTMDDGR